jgi:hypothetical protein
MSHRRKARRRDSSPPQAHTARLTDFIKHKNSLLRLLREQHDRGPKGVPFDSEDAWASVRFAAWVYLQSKDAEVANKAHLAPDDRKELLAQLGSALHTARCRADEALENGLGEWFIAWASADGDPDFLSPALDLCQARFDAALESLLRLEEAAKKAASMLSIKRGRPPGYVTLPHDVIMNLESAYRNHTGKHAGTGRGPFFRFVADFLMALGSECPDETVIGAIQNAKRREDKHTASSRWGRNRI